MSTVHTILLVILGVIWLSISIVILINTLQSVVYDRRSEKRKKEQAIRDQEYHELHMKESCK